MKTSSNDEGGHVSDESSMAGSVNGDDESNVTTSQESIPTPKKLSTAHVSSGEVLDRKELTPKANKSASRVFTPSRLQKKVKQETPIKRKRESFFAGDSDSN
jgi:hypothetical protein